MDTITQVAPDDVRHSESGLETKAGRAPVRSRVAAPAIHTRSADPVRAIAAKIDAQGRAIEGLQRKASKNEVTRRLAAIKSRATHVLRSTVDKRDALARKGRGDVLLTQKIDRINRAIDTANAQEVAELKRQNAELSRRLQRPPLVRAGGPGGGYSQRNQAQLIHRAATLHYLRTGETNFRGHSLSDLQRRAAPDFKTSHGGSGPDGGFLLMPEYETGPMERLLKESVPMRAHASVKSINAYTYKAFVRTKTGGAKWGTELASSGKTDGPKFSLLDFPAHNLYAEPAVSSDMLEDAGINMETEIADGCLEDFTVAENNAFVAGDGVEKPFGFLGYESARYVENATDWGKIGWMKTGVNGAFPTSSGSTGSGDPIVQLEYMLKQQYRQNAKFMMNRLTIGVCRTLKDGSGRYIWADSDVSRGQPATLSGREVIEAEDMPVIATGSYSIALADWARAYVIVDRTGMVVLRDPFSDFPAVVFKTRKRVGGGIKNFEAIKLLKFAA